MDMEAIDRRVAELFPSLADRRRFSTHADTTDFYNVDSGDVLLPDLARSSHPAMDRIAPEDRNIVFHHRLANLKRVYPYVPESLSRILLHFSMGTNGCYEHVDQLLEDLSSVRL